MNKPTITKTTPSPAPAERIVRAADQAQSSGRTGDADKELRLPHERDQSADSTSSRVDPRIKQAKDDIDAGQVDTDLRQAPGLDAPARKKIMAKPGSSPQSVPEDKR
ncbi:hypothetical protein [Ottowia thiooxydans]|uniref:Uncharacterized protein n=1 Tax=Ottowia thiooxydans TaxID=219182 RepID=A0ABV2QHE9_9BURK